MSSSKKWLVGSIIVSAGLLVGSALSIQADGATVSGSTPGSVDDPVVTKSYVDQQIQKALGGNISVPAATQGSAGSTSTSTSNAANTANHAKDTNTSTSADTGTALKVVTVKAEQKLIAHGGTELVVRVGKAVVVTEGDGISDLTDGKDISNGQAVQNNHLLLVPRDGRGISPDPAQANGLTVLVRGGYEIQ